MPTSPVAERAYRLATLANNEFDVLVVGGGITGAGIARDAALRGLRVALVEKDDFASGTSSRSSRLVHGGLRYLEHGHLHLVFEASMERRRLLRVAPHLVRPLAFVWPVYTGARVPRWKLEAGLALYDALALFRNVGQHQALSRNRVLAGEPGLRQNGLRGGARYFDAETNDARLTLANAIDAAELGAVVLNHVAMQDVLLAKGRAAGAQVIDTLGGQKMDVRARVVVNATGPWNQVVRGSKGVHIQLPRRRVGNHGALTLLSPADGRVMFVLPAGDHSIVGTTETTTTASPDEVHASDDDLTYLLDAANHFFPDAHLTNEDVISAWAGIRPLVASGAADAGSASREHAITTDARGVVSITGGKLTTYRIMAAQVTAAVQRALGKPVDRAPTRRRLLPGGDVNVPQAIGTAQHAVGDLFVADHLVRAHGSRWTAVWNEMQSRPDGAERVSPDLPYTLGELRYAVQAEMACTLADLLLRRTHLAFETRDHGASVAARVAAAVAPLLDWRGRRVDEEIDRYAADAARMFAIGGEAEGGRR